MRAQQSGSHGKKEERLWPMRGAPLAGSRHFQSRSDVVPVAGVEPARCRHRRILSFAGHTEDDAYKEKMTELVPLEKCRNINALSVSSRKKPVPQELLLKCNFGAKKGNRRSIGGPSKIHVHGH